MFGITLSEIDVALDIVILMALIINAMVISKALEIVDELYDRANMFLSSVVAVGTLGNMDEEEKEEVIKLFEDEWP